MLWLCARLLSLAGSPRPASRSLIFLCDTSLYLKEEKEEKQEEEKRTHGKKRTISTTLRDD